SVSNNMALTAAAAKGNTMEVQRILEECRVHPDTLNEFGRTAPVMMMGNAKIATLLLEKEPTPTSRTSTGSLPSTTRPGPVSWTPCRSGALPIHIAIREGHRDVVKFLAPRSDLKHANTSGQTAIDVARASCVPDMIDLLFAHIHS
uniref:Cyclin-dependent kinase inhibitor 2D (p19, inhibits CDK4) n=1 Tax=Salarias fasciatus TaxID=181472 RepID=A0A672GDU1_SALFA